MTGVSTIPEVTARLRRMQDKAPMGARAAAVGMGLIMAREVKTNELTRYSHSPGTVTPSPPGQPPALITGALRGSVIVTPPVSRGPLATVTVGGTVVYARIQELGGVTGRNHATRLPPRPYIKPAAERVIGTGQAKRAAVKGWVAVMGRA